MQHYATTVGNLLGDKTLYDRPPIKDAASFETMIGGKQVGNLIKRNELIMNKLDCLILILCLKILKEL